MKHYLILGSGASALGCATLLRKYNCSVSVSDEAPLTDKAHDTFKALGCQILSGPQTADILTPFDVILVSPGIPLTTPIVIAAKKLGKIILSEVDLALSYYHGLRLGVTGTNGKSTVVTLFEHLGKNLGLNCIACGNLGLTPSGLMAQGQHPSLLVLELSSYQLELSQGIQCQAAIFTSFSPDHLQRHKTMENYLTAKWNLAQQTLEGGLIVLSESFADAVVEYKLPLPQKRKLVVVNSSGLGKTYPGFQLANFDEATRTLTYDGHRITLSSQASLHDNLNLCYCLIGLEAFTENRDYQKIVRFYDTYKKLPHRFEIFSHIRDCALINDSKSTNLESALVAIRSMPGPCYLLLGGQGKGETFGDLSNCKDLIKRVFCFGASGNQIHQDVKAELSSQAYSKLEDALKDLARYFRKDPLPVLFSPACASFDEFLNFEERGLYFKKVLPKLLE